MTQPVQPTCKTCRYFFPFPAEYREQIASQNGGKYPTPEPGLCRRDPPKTHFVPVQVMQRQNVASAIMSGGKAPPMQAAMQMQLQSVFPVVNVEASCGEHPEYVLRRESEKHAKYFQHMLAFSDRLKFDPGTHGDANAGFNRPPTLDEARRYDPTRTPDKPPPRA